MNRMDQIERARHELALVFGHHRPDICHEQGCYACRAYWAAMELDAALAGLVEVYRAAKDLRHEDWHDAPMAQSWEAVTAFRIAFENGTVQIPNDPVLVNELEAYSYPICGAVHKMNEDDIKQQKYLVELLRRAVDEGWPERATSAVRHKYEQRDPFRFSEDDVLDAHEQMPDRIPSEWMDRA